MQTSTCPDRILLATAFLLVMGPAVLGQKDGIVVPSYVEKYDLCTRADLRYSRLLDRFLGDPATPEKWLLFRQIKKEMSSAVATALDAQTIADTVTTALQIEGQEAAKPIQDLVADCARVLHMDPPRVWIKQSPVVNASAGLLTEPHFLIIHSGLLELYEGRPQELRFVIGHELGHMKCDHLMGLAVGRKILDALSVINVLTIPEEYQRALPAIGLGRLFSWCREAEIGADRAGLLCCQDKDVAQQALMRMFHGLKFDSPWLDPQHKDFDPERVVAEFERWENEPLVKFILFLKRLGTTHPFIPQRIAAIRLWYGSGMPQGILARKENPKKPRVLRINEVSLSGLQENNETVNPYCCIYHEGMITQTLSTARGNPNPIWQDINHAIDWLPGQPIFIEVWSNDWDWTHPWRRDALLAEAAIFPKEGQTKYAVSMERNLIDRKTTLKPAMAEVTVQFMTVEKN